MGGRTALLINATQEFGLSIVRKLAQHGHNIVLSGASNPMGDDGMRRQGEVVYFPADLQNESDRYALVERIRDRFQSIDSVVINRVGQRHYRASVDEFPIEHWRDAIDHHLTSTFGLVKTIWPQMKSQHFGRIIQIADEYDVVESEYKSACMALHYATLGLNRALAIEGAPFGITSNIICPGSKSAHFVEQHHHITTVAELVAFLCTEQARAITGEVIPWDYELLP